MLLPADDLPLPSLYTAFHSAAVLQTALPFPHQQDTFFLIQIDCK